MYALLSIITIQKRFFLFSNKSESQTICFFLFFLYCLDFFFECSAVLLLCIVFVWVFILSRMAIMDSFYFIFHSFRLFIDDNVLPDFNETIHTLHSTYLAQEVVIQWHLTLRVDVLQVPAEALALQSLAKLLPFADVACGSLPSSCYVFFDSVSIGKWEIGAQINTTTQRKKKQENSVISQQLIQINLGCLGIFMLAILVLHEVKGWVCV